MGPCPVLQGLVELAVPVGLPLVQVPEPVEVLEGVEPLPHLFHRRGPLLLVVQQIAGRPEAAVINLLREDS